MPGPSSSAAVRSPASTFGKRAEEALGAPLRALTLDTVQANVGLRCNLACRHCHVESSPVRREEMDWPTMEWVLRAAAACSVRLLDITGGAPELHPHLRAFVSAAARQGHQVMLRTNLTVLLAPECANLPEFFREQRVKLVASLPCYLEENVDRQRGARVFRESLEALRRLNALGYGVREDLALDLVYNPLGPALPPGQENLEKTYHAELERRHGVRFTHLSAIANMPIGRFLLDLRQQRREGAYQRLLESAFNPATLSGLMCRHQISVRWDGTLYDCDFNLALDLPVAAGAPRQIREFAAAAVRGRLIATGTHCFGCAAGKGSSCGGALA